MQFEQLLIVKEGTLSICPFKLSLFTYKNKFSCSQLNTFYFYTKVTEIKHKEMVSIKSAIKKLYDNP